MGLYRTGMTTGGNITVDDQLSTTSVNPVQNKVITNALNNKQDELTAGSGINIDSNNTISADMSGYQKFIGQDLLPPSGSDTTGRLIFKGTEGTSNKDLYRYESDQWVKIDFGGANVTYGDSPPQNAKDGDVFFLVDSQNVTGVAFRAGGAWHNFGISGGGSAVPTVRMRQVLDTGFPQSISVSIRNSTS